MARKIITEEMREKIKNLYKQGLKNREIGNLVDLAPETVSRIVKVFIDNGSLEPKRPSAIGKKRAPKGQGKGKYVKKGYNPVNKKLSPEQEKQLLFDYFENNFTYKQIMAKYNLWQGSIKIIVDKAIRQGLYQPKGQGNNQPKKHITRRTKNDDNR